MNLNEKMELDHVVRVHADGTVTDGPADLYAPDLYGEDEHLDGAEPWEFFSTGYTGQTGYNGPIMHNSEFVGGQLEKDILAQPGYYAAIPCMWMPAPGDDTENNEYSFAEGWAVVYLPERES